jgi:hypothetical protein
MNHVEQQSQNGLTGRQRLAWAVVLVSFFLCAALTVTLPLSVNAYLQNATRRLTTIVQANQGTVGITAESGGQRAVFGSSSGQAVEVEPQEVISTDTNASALMLVSPPEASDPLTRLQISSNTTLVLQQADAPRFEWWSRAGHRLDLELQSGRVRVVVPEFMDRPLTLQFTTPQGALVTIEEPGQYSLEVNDDITQVTVLGSGRALVEGNGQTVMLLPGQRTELAAGGLPSGPLDPARNLVSNGDFSRGLRDWVTYAWFIDLAGQAEGTTEVRPIDGDQTLRFTRDGIGHADVQISQTINQDVFGSSSLQLQLTLNLVRHSLGVCGNVGSECPLFVRVEYIDEGGINRTWQHGFYAEGVVDANSTPDACTSCALIQQVPHERVPLNQLYYYEVELIEELARQGFLPPRFIQRITLIASGHTFETEVSDVGLIVEE